MCRYGLCLLRHVCLGSALKPTALHCGVKRPRVLLVVSKNLQGKEMFLSSEINYFSLLTLATGAEEMKSFRLMGRQCLTGA